MDERDVKIILALADNRMNVSSVAVALFMHRNTVVYHIEKIKRITGLDPTDFHDLCKLVQMVRGMESDSCEHVEKIEQFKWIPVTERLPEDWKERVLVKIKDANNIIGHPDMDTDRYMGEIWVRWGHNVTHWMPLPQPPKGE